jgi:hypothetical protein
MMVFIGGVLDAANYGEKIMARTVGAPLAQWLHNFLNSHTEPYPYTVEKYMELTESRSKNIAEFRSRMKIALERLCEIGFLTRWEIDNKSDTVKVTLANVRLDDVDR